MEIWRETPSLSGYEASSWGRLRCIPFKGAMPNGGTRIYGGKPILGVWSQRDNRYIIVHKGKTYKVARLICEAFHGKPPKEKPYCLHKDENSKNNSPDNLCWGTQKENLNAPGFLSYASQACRHKMNQRKFADPRKNEET